MVCEAANKLEQGINVGCKKRWQKAGKFMQQKHISENNTIPNVISKLIDKSQDNVFVFDRGVKVHLLFFFSVQPSPFSVSNRSSGLISSSLASAVVEI